MAIIPETIRLFIALFGIGFADSVADFFAAVVIVFPKNVISCSFGNIQQVLHILGIRNVKFFSAQFGKHAGK